jgi:hypothetical protein
MIRTLFEGRDLRAANQAFLRISSQVASEIGVFGLMQGVASGNVVACDGRSGKPAPGWQPSAASGVRGFIGWE